LRFVAGSIVALWLVAAALGGQSTAKKKTAPAGSVPAAVRRSSSSAKAAPKKATASTAAKTPLAKSGVSKTGASKAGTKSKKAVVARRPPVQQQPSSNRYKEIQQALADKGYFRGTADGTWNGDSIEALKRFQKDQNLDPDGKIGALSLMALGLGPQHGVPSAQAARGGVEPVDPPPVAQPPHP
jgi:peptidoglycan hydrolase-like protein with peptidoglycan-binding domain